MRKVVMEQNKTLVMVTHDNHLATFADRIFHIIDGKIVKVEERDHRDAKISEAATVEELLQKSARENVDDTNIDDAKEYDTIEEEDPKIAEADGAVMEEKEEKMEEEV